MNINIVVGKKSNLSKQLSKSIENIYLISSDNILEEFNKIHFVNYDSINIIFNQFQTASKLNDISEPTKYINRSIYSTSLVLDYIKKNNIKVNKIIYTSSSSVYGNNTLCKEDDMTQALSLHSSLKIANEKLIEQFSSDNNIDFTITRIFNMYGRDDNFSIISKIISNIRNKKELTLVNNGEAIRDFIHIDDVVSIYKKLLNLKNTQIINIGTGESKSILFLIDFLKENNVDLKTNNIYKNELKVSICNIDKLLNVMGNTNFNKVEEYLLNQVKQDCKQCY